MVADDIGVNSGDEGLTKHRSSSLRNPRPHSIDTPGPIKPARRHHSPALLIPLLLGLSDIVAAKEKDHKPQTVPRTHLDAT